MARAASKHRIVGISICALCVGACHRDGGASATTAPSSSPSASGSTGAASPSAGGVAKPPVPPVERFIAAQLRDGGGVDVGAITRDGGVHRMRFDTTLRLLGDDVLASGLRARDDSHVDLVGDEALMVSGILDGKSGTFLLRPGEPAQPMDADACMTGNGVAWLSRDASGTRVRFAVGHRGVAIVDSGLIGAPLDREVHIACGHDSVAVTTSDGEQLQLARVRLGAGFDAAPKLVEVERDSDFDDELRDRAVVVRGSGEVVVVRIGDKTLATRTITDAGASPWMRAKADASAGVPLDDDATLVATAAEPSAGGRIFLLTSDPTKGTCGGGDDTARRIVVRTLEASGGAASSASGDAGAKPSVGAASELQTKMHPIVELPCGVEAIAAHLEAEGDHARVWWTEPASAERCAQPGLTVGAVVEATSGQPGARALPTLAEGAARVAAGRWLTVVRPGGCAPYAAEGAGALAWTVAR